MPDNINEKVISIFAKHKKQQSIDNDDEKIVRNEDGFYYICIQKDSNGRPLVEKNLLERLNKCHYIVKVMIKQPDHAHIHNYRVPGDKILKFLLPYINKEKEGKILEIDTYYPDELA